MVPPGALQSSAFALQPCLQPRSSPVEHLPILNTFFLGHLLLLEVSYLNGNLSGRLRVQRGEELAEGLVLALSPQSGPLLTFKLFVCIVGSPS